MWAIGREAFLGIGAATLAGLVGATALKPSLTDFSGGPQTMMPASPNRIDRDIDQGVAWPYRGKVPDYVIGTDWLKGAEPPPVAAYAGPAEYKPEPVAAANDVQITPASYEEPPRAAPRYPSEAGDILAGVGEAADASATEDLPPPDPPPA